MVASSIPPKKSKKKNYLAHKEQLAEASYFFQPDSSTDRNWVPTMLRGTF
jgi:hypothetical protein